MPRRAYSTRRGSDVHHRATVRETELIGALWIASERSISQASRETGLGYFVIRRAYVKYQRLVDEGIVPEVALQAAVCDSLTPIKMVHAIG